jgi:two-component system cell cycle response regulator DivK
MSGERVLVVEDNQLNMKLLRDVLRRSGYAVVEANTGRSAIRLAALQAPVLVLMDVQLPDLDGIEALRRLREEQRTAAIPVLAVTAQAMERDRERLLAAGFDGYISKPVDVAALLATVKRHCDGVLD